MFCDSCWKYGEYISFAIAMANTEIKNATQVVTTRTKLTDQVYHYDVTDKVFEKASRYEDRRIEKEESKTFAGTKKTPRREDVSL